MLHLNDVLRNWLLLSLIRIKWRTMIGVILREGESIESALKRFKKECVNSGIQSEIKRREFFEKPSEKKKRKIEAAQRKREKRKIILLRRDRA